MKPGALPAKTPHLMSLLNFSQCDHPIHQILWFWLCIHIKLNFLPEINFPTKKFHVLEHLRQCDTSNYKPYGGSRLSFDRPGITTDQFINIPAIRQVCVFDQSNMLSANPGDGRGKWSVRNVAEPQYPVKSWFRARLFTDMEHCNQSCLIDEVLTKWKWEKWQCAPWLL